MRHWLKSAPSMSRASLFHMRHMRRQFMQNFLPKMNIGVSVIKPNDFAALNKALDEHKVSVVDSPMTPLSCCCVFSTVFRLRYSHD